VTTAWLSVAPGPAPLVVSLPHTGTDIPPSIEARLRDAWRARKDADWWIDRLHAQAGALGATVVRTALSRTVVDVNRDPSGASLYPGQAITGLCPTDTFDGEPLYAPGQEPDEAEIARRRAAFFEPYHAALRDQLARLRAAHRQVVLYDAHAIRSRIPRLFDGELPHLNIGTNAGAACDPALTRAVERACDSEQFAHVTDGRFKGGWITRSHGRPEHNVHAIQMEVACRAHMDEPDQPTSENWPPDYDPARAAPLAAVLGRVLAACLAFTGERR